MKEKRCSYCGCADFEHRVINEGGGETREGNYCASCGHFAKGVGGWEFQIVSRDWGTPIFEKSGAVAGEVLQDLRDKAVKGGDPNIILELFVLEAACGHDVAHLIEQLPLLSEAIDPSQLWFLYLIDVDQIDDGKARKNIRERLKSAYKKLLTRRGQWFRDKLEDSSASDFRTLVPFVEKECVLQILNVELLFKKNFVFEPYESWYPELYFAAEYNASKSNWHIAFLMFQKLHSFNKLYELTDQDVEELFEFYVSGFPDETQPWGLPEGLSVESIEKQARECCRKYTRDMSADENLEFVSDLTFQMFALDDTLYDERSNRRREREVHNKLQNIWVDIAASKREEAYQKWIDWNKTDVKIGGLDYWGFTCFLKGLRDNPEDPTVIPRWFEWARIRWNYEAEIREFITWNGEQKYGVGWEWQFLPQKTIRNIAGPLKESRRKRKPIESCSFSDYVDIICDESNWEPVFKKWFCLRKADYQKNSKQLTGMLRKLIQIRNLEGHSIPLTDEEEKEMRESYEEWRKVYDNWKREMESSRPAQRSGPDMNFLK